MDTLLEPMKEKKRLEKQGEMKSAQQKETEQSTKKFQFFAAMPFIGLCVDGSWLSCAWLSLTT